MKTVAPLAWQTVAELLLQIQEDLDRDWTVEELARIAGYDIHHFAHTFTALIGISPRRYVRRLRLERAAFQLREYPQMRVLDIAIGAGYTSGEAFQRAFRKVFGVSPTELRASDTLPSARESEAPRILGETGDGPGGLSFPPRIECRSWRGHTVMVPSFEPGDVVPAMMALLESAPMPEPWQFGGVAQPWGWDSGTPFKELRCLRLVDEDLPPPAPPLMVWRCPEQWFATFDYHGPIDGIASVCEWLVSTWIPRAGLRFGYAPLISLLKSFGEDPTRARLHVPIHSIEYEGL